ncbi:helix-turn-helix transcriptional regulator [Streptomyces sp. NPDC051320]|uniref:helix-turn-helix domain-containing protein n=1 Tax=Streptomyces sp. NPDC051320 TaxID=3154644 RepID=UPI003431254C
MPTEPMTASRLAVIHSAVARDTPTPQTRAIQELLQEVGRLTPATPTKCPLTRSELPILLDVAHGHTARRSAEHRGLSPHTVKQHRRNIYRRLGVVTAAQAVAVAMKHGWITHQDIRQPGEEQR